MTSRQQAEGIAGRIRGYWASKGLYPAIWVEPARMSASETDARLHWVVRSDMACGCPQPDRDPASKINPRLTADSAMAKRPLAGIRQPITAPESVQPPQPFWRAAPHTHHAESR